jgi:NitT/TauT family transport system ATP-binding protein
MHNHEIKVEHVGKAFQARSGTIDALDDVSLHVADQEFVALIGPSGCGKSTLLRILAGLTRATSGDARLGEEVIDAPHPQIGMVFQGYASFPWLTVLENTLFGPDLQGIDREESEPIARDILKRVGLTKFVDVYPTQLSGGMQQRVAIARTLANKPDVLLMDEPFGALDALTRVDMQELILRLWQEERKTVVFVTHDIDEAIYLADRIVVLAPHPGRLHEICEVDLPRPRTMDTIEEPRFIELRAHLRRTLFGMKTPAAET